MKAPFALWSGTEVDGPDIRTGVGTVAVEERRHGGPLLEMTLCHVRYGLGHRAPRRQPLGAAR